MLEALVEWVLTQVEAWGYAGIFVMMFVESTFFPFPSEVAMVPAGYLAFHGKIDPFVATLMGLLGSLAGAYFNYYFARIAGLPFLQRYGKYFFVPAAKLERATAAFQRHGEMATFVCRMIPVVRQLISVPAGIARMSLARFGFYTGLGAGIWVSILTGFGWFVGSTLAKAESDPSSGLGSAWQAIRGLWKEHEVVIYLSIGLPLLVLLAVYVLAQRRRVNAADTVAVSSTTEDTQSVPS